MTTIDDPKDPRYLDEADVRGELTRVFDVCSGCRQCVDLCGSFPTLFDLLAEHGADHRGDDGDHDAGRLTPDQQDRVVDACFQCKRCALDCPFGSELHEQHVDVPSTMLRADAMRRANGLHSAARRAAGRVLGRPDRLGASRTVHRFAGAEPGSAARTLLAKVAGVSPVRLLPPYAKERFSTWFERRPGVTLTRRQGRVTVFPTCLVEYQQPAIGRDLVRVYERNGIECAVTSAGCCGAPLLHSGDIDGFAAVARRNVAILAEEVRAGTDVVVPQATCSYVIRHDYAVHVGGEDAVLVAEHTADAAEYLMRVHDADGSRLDTDFRGDTVGSITYHAPCHVRAQDMGYPSRDLLKLTGADVTVVQECSGVGGTWGYRTGNDAASLEMAERFGDRIADADDDAVAGDCHLANTAVVEQTGRTARHPLQIVARAYGIADEVADEPAADT